MAESNYVKIKGNDLQEFVGQIIDIIEDELEAHEVKPAHGKGAIVVGSYYDSLESDITNLLKAWGIA